MEEPNQRSLWVGSAIDETPDGHFEFSGEVAVPAALGGGEGGGGATKKTSYVVKVGYRRKP